MISKVWVEVFGRTERDFYMSDKQIVWSRLSGVLRINDEHGVIAEYRENVVVGIGYVVGVPERVEV